MNETRLLRPALWQGLTLRDLVNAAAIEAPAAGLITDIGLDGRRLHFTARTLDHIANRVARRFATAGAQKGDAILIALPNGASALIALLGALGAGLTPCLAPPTLDDESIALILRRLKPRSIVSAKYESFDPLSRFVTTARRLAMPLYMWNFGPLDHDHAAPLADLLNGEAPARLLPLQAPAAGDGAILTVWDRGDGPEPVIHRQDGLLAQAMLARLAYKTQHKRMVSALAMTSQAGLILGPLRALLTRTPLTFIADPGMNHLARAAADGTAEWIMPRALRAMIDNLPLLAHQSCITLARTGETVCKTEDANFISFGEALTLPARPRGEALQPGPITLGSADGPLHFADLKINLDGSLIVTSTLAGRTHDDQIAAPSLYSTLRDDGAFAHFTPNPWRP